MSAPRPTAAAPAPELVCADAEDEDELSLAAEFLLFLREERRWWLAPIVAVMLLVSGLILFAEGSALAPFLYPLF